MLGFYDSGVGGLTIVDKFLQLRPKLQTVYLADTVNCPLGNKTDVEILRITRQGVEFLFARGCQLVILACNTATSLTIRYLQQVWLPRQKQYAGRNILGVIKPVTEELIAQRENAEPVLILATVATCRSGFYQQELAAEGFQRYYCLSFTELARAIELQDSHLIQQSLTKTLQTVNLTQYRSFVLACTHYPLIKPQIVQTLGEQIGHRNFQILDQSQLAATKLSQYLAAHPQYIPATGRLQIYLSAGHTRSYADKIQTLFPKLEFEIQLLDIGQD